jgi:hypothetical protein
MSRQQNLNKTWMVWFARAVYFVANVGHRTPRIAGSVGVIQCHFDPMCALRRLWLAKRRFSER